jgi:hypothetical protein
MPVKKKKKAAAAGAEKKCQVTGRPSSVEPAGTAKQAQTVCIAQWLMHTSLAVPEQGLNCRLALFWCLTERLACC